MALEMLDLGVILSSETNWVFMDMVERYPGAKYFYDSIVARGDEEGETELREQMQVDLHSLFRGDREKCAKFFELLSHEQSPAQESVVRSALISMGMKVSTRHEREAEDPILQTLRDMFPGMKVIRTELPD